MLRSELKSRTTCAVFYGIFALSGFTGLIYESIWSHYLKLFLGHAAYAQVLVLAIFMGGMSLGAWLSGRLVGRLANPILAYALVEAAIGFLGIAFDPLFRKVTAVFLEEFLPHLHAVHWVQACKWGTAAALILPQSILLGATFPLMSNGLLRRFPQAPGRTLGVLYFSNSIGAAAGVMMSGFVLISLFGLPGTILTAGLVNVVLALVAYGIAGPRGAAPERPAAPGASAMPAFLLFAALITGLSSFIYEVIWIRMLSMVLGSSTHAFEMMLSAFITGLAFGGLWIRKRMGSGHQSMVIAGRVQIIMGIAAFATVPLYNSAFDLMAFFMAGLDRSDTGYLFFNVYSHMIALAIMLPATFTAGMTLPLFTVILLNTGFGERSVGYVYAANTLGAIAGTFLASFVLLPLFRIEGGMLAGSMLDIGIGILFYRVAARRSGGNQPVLIAAGVLSLLVVVLAALAYGPDPRRMASSVFRYGNPELRATDKVLAHYDGATASVTVLEYASGTRVIATNGKPDAAAMMRDGGEHSMDQDTMVLAAAIPLAMKPAARHIAVIGFGSGITTHTALASPSLERVDTIEIERFMHEGARYFEQRSERAYNDPRSRVHFEDAKTFFHYRPRRYDVIISEPSNPWVSGTASLFTGEFYEMVKRYLERDGILVQWIHAYELDENILYSVLKPISLQFHDYQVFATNHLDLLVLASPSSTLPLPGDGVFEFPLMKRELALVQVRSRSDLLQRYLANKTMLLPELALSGVPPNSDYFPYVDLNATRTRFMAGRMLGLHDIREFSVPVLLLFEPEIHSAGTPTSATATYGPSRRMINAARLAAGNAEGGMLDESLAQLLPDLALLRISAQSCDEETRDLAWEHAFLNIMAATVAFLDPDRLKTLGKTIEPRCLPGPDEPGSLLNALMQGYALRDMRMIADSSAALLAIRARYNQVHREFLFGSLVLALMVLHEYREADRVWRESANEIFHNAQAVPYPLRLLHSRLSALPASRRPPGGAG